MKTKLLIFSLMGVITNLFVHAGEKEHFQVAKLIASQDAKVRIEARSEALAAGPEIIPVLRDVQTAEAKEIVGNYDRLIQSTDKNASRAAIKFFSQRKAPSFLAGSLPDIANADMKIVAVQQMRAMGTNQVASVLTTLADVLASEDVYKSGSEATTLHTIYVEELAGLIASVLGEDVTPNLPLGRKVQAVLTKARAFEKMKADVNENGKLVYERDLLKDPYPPVNPTNIVIRKGSAPDR